MDYLKKQAKIEELKEIIETDEQAIKDITNRLGEIQEAIDYLEENMDVPKQYLNFGPLFLKFKNDKAQILLNQEKRDLTKFLKNLETNFKNNKVELNRKVPSYKIK